MTFYETQFPTGISYDVKGGPMRVTDIVTLRSGFEEVNSIWQNSRRKWDAAYGLKDHNDLHTVLSFWEAMGGRRHQFRWKDWADYKSAGPLSATTKDDQNIGTGDGSTVAFQLIKTYVTGAASYIRTIKKPVSGTVKIALDGVNQASGWSVDTTSGIVTFSSAPGAGVAVTAGFEFDVPVRFNSDELSTSLEFYQAGTSSIDIIEVKV